MAMGSMFVSNLNLSGSDMYTRVIEMQDGSVRNVQGGYENLKKQDGAKMRYSI